jgi:opacity protein-like surface antigen
MKRFLLCLCAIIALSSSVSFAQTHGMYIGTEGGPNRTSIWGNEYITKSGEPKKAPNFFTGASFEFCFTEFTSLRTGLAFERKGVRFMSVVRDEYSNPIGSVPARNYLDYLTLPLMAKVAFGKKPKFFVNAGPYIGYLISQKDVIYDSEFMNAVITVNNSERYKKLDMGFTAGLGTEMPLTDKVKLSFELRQNLGVYNVYNVPTFFDGIMKTNSTNLLFGLAYKIKEY